MKVKIATTINCNRETCGLCENKKVRWFPCVDLRCSQFKTKHNTFTELKQKRGGATLRCQQCLDAEIKGEEDNDTQ